MPSPPIFTVNSIGGGVQSSVMTFMESEGAADARREAPSLCAHLKRLEGQLQVPLHVADNGRSLRHDAKALASRPGPRSKVDIPAYLRGRNGGPGGMRQCADNYKTRATRRRMRKPLSLRPGQRVPNGPSVEPRLGISAPHAGLPSPVDHERLPAHGGGNLRKRLRRLELPRQSGETRFDAGQPTGVSWPYQVGPAMLQTPRAAAPPDRAGDANRLYYSQTRSPAGGGSFSI